MANRKKKISLSLSMWAVDSTYCILSGFTGLWMFSLVTRIFNFIFVQKSNESKSVKRICWVCMWGVHDNVVMMFFMYLDIYTLSTLLFCNLKIEFNFVCRIFVFLSLFSWWFYYCLIRLCRYLNVIIESYEIILRCW